MDSKDLTPEINPSANNSIPQEVDSAAPASNVENPSETVLEQKLSSEENFSPDYELYSKRPEVSKKQNVMMVILGVLLAATLIIAVIYLL